MCSVSGHSHLCGELCIACSPRPLESHDMSTPLHCLWAYEQFQFAAITNKIIADSLSSVCLWYMQACILVGLCLGVNSWNRRYALQHYQNFPKWLKAVVTNQYFCQQCQNFSVFPVLLTFCRTSLLYNFQLCLLLLFLLSHSVVHGITVL